jgi:hypothetical protein
VDYEGDRALLVDAFFALYLTKKNGRFVINATEATTIELTTDLTASCSVSSSMTFCSTLYIEPEFAGWRPRFGSYERNWQGTILWG